MASLPNNRSTGFGDMHKRRTEVEMAERRRREQRAGGQTRAQAQTAPTVSGNAPARPAPPNLNSGGESMTFQMPPAPAAATSAATTRPPAPGTSAVRQEATVRDAIGTDFGMDDVRSVVSGLEQEYQANERNLMVIRRRLRRAESMGQDSEADRLRQIFDSRVAARNDLQARLGQVRGAVRPTARNLSPAENDARRAALQEQFVASREGMIARAEEALKDARDRKDGVLEAERELWEVLQIPDTLELGGEQLAERDENLRQQMMGERDRERMDALRLELRRQDTQRRLRERLGQTDRDLAVAQGDAAVIEARAQAAAGNAAIAGSAASVAGSEADVSEAELRRQLAIQNREAVEATGGTRLAIAEAQAQFDLEQSQEQLDQLMNKVAPPATPEEVATVSGNLFQSFIDVTPVVADGGAVETDLAALAANFASLKNMPARQRAAVSRDMISALADQQYDPPEAGEVTGRQKSDMVFKLLKDAATEALLPIPTLLQGDLPGQGAIREAQERSNQTVKVGRALRGMYDQLSEWARASE